MRQFKKVVKSVGSNRVHPTESQDADSEMAAVSTPRPDPPRRRRQSFGRDVLEIPASQMESTSQKSGSVKSSPDIVSARRSGAESRLPVAPLFTRSTSPAFRRRSLSNGSVGADFRELEGEIDAHASGKRASVPDNRQPHQKNGHSKSVDSRREKDPKADAVEAAPRANADHLQSVALQRFFSSAEMSNSWSAASKKMIFGTDLDDSKLQNRAKLEAR